MFLAEIKLVIQLVLEFRNLNSVEGLTDSIVNIAIELGSNLKYMEH